MTDFLHGQSKIFFIPKKDIQRTKKLRLSNSKAPTKDKRYLLTSYKDNEVIERAPRETNGNVTLMAQGAKQDFILHFATNRMLQSCFPVNNKVQTTFTPILIPDKTLIADKNTRELGNNVNPPSKKFSRFGTFLC